MVNARRFIGLLAVVSTALAGAIAVQPAARAASTCVSTPMTNPITSATYTVTVCLTAPETGTTLSGTVPVTGTVSFTGTSPGVQRMIYSLNGEYLLTDYATPYTFQLKTPRFVDGSYTLALQALLRDGNTTPATTISVTLDNGVTTPPVNTNTFTPPQGTPVAPGTTFTVAAAGDGAGGEASETNVTNLIGTMNPNLTLYLGDVYEKGTPTEFDNWYGLNQPGNTFYGRFRDITLPTIGNHEYTAGQAQGYFDYWDNTPHYYSVDRHGWHIVSLDTNAAFGQTAVGTAQYDWLSADLAANTSPCTLVFYHQPRFNIGDEGPSTYLQPFWDLFAQQGVDLVVNGHDHTYQRYQPLDGAGNPSPTGVTEIINGAGGHALGAFPQTDSRLAASAQQFGVLKLGLNSAGASYQFVTTSGAVLDNGSAACDTTQADNASPSTPTGLAASATYKTRIDLNWTQSTDNVGVTQYRILRDGVLLDTVVATDSYSDTTVTPGSTHTYEVRAVDAAGNVSGASGTASATTPTVAVLFNDGFETGDLSRWLNPGGTTTPTNAGLVAQTDDVFAGTYAARSSSAGTTGSSAWKILAQPESSLYYVARFKAIAHSSTVALLRARAGTASSSPIVTVGLSTTNRVTLRTDGAPTPVSTTSASTATPGAWHTVQLHVTVNGAAGSTEVWLDGTRLDDLSFAATDLGINPVAKVELGDPGSATAGRTFNVAYDEVAFDREFIGDLTAPTAPTGLTATAHSGLAVDLAWTAGTDDVGIAGYDVYRNGALLTSIPAGTSYRDTAVTPGTGYTYQLIARDAAGNSSGYSNRATVQTGDIFADGFETGTLSRWSTVAGLTTSQALVDTGTWAARATSDSTAGASAQVTLDAGVNDLYYRLRFQRVSQGANPVTLARVRTSGNAAIATVFVSSLGKLAYRNDLTGVSTTSGTTVAPGVWHELQLHTTIGTAGQIELWLDGTNVVTQTEALGTSPVARLELGEPAIGRVFDYAYDGVLASSAFVLDTADPSAPSNLQVTGTAADHVDLAWTPASDDVGIATYRIQRDGVPVGEVDGATTTYSDVSSQPNQTYTYTVFALDAVGHRSPASNAVTVDTPDTQAPSAPTGVTGSPVAGQGRIDLTWNAATDNRGVTGYRVYRSDQVAPLATLGTTLSYSDTTVASATAYTYSITALDAAGNESGPGTVTVTSADTVAPTAPGTPTVVAVTDSSVALAWTAATDAVGVTGYSVYRDGAAAPVATFSGSTLTWTDSGLAADSLHSYTVKARDAAGNVSAASGTGTGRPLVFTDGFETGNLSRWNAGGNLSVQSALKFTGSFAGRATSPRNSAVFAVKTLPATYTDLTYSARFFLNGGRQDTTNFLRFRTAAGSNVLSLAFTNNKKLAYVNDTLARQVVSNVSVNPGVWYDAKVRVVVNGNASQVTVWLNGAPIPALTGTLPLGTTPVGQVVAGESNTGQTYDVVIDDVQVSRTT